jgi:hypothetical protein
VIRVTHQEGGDWVDLVIHSLQMPNGAEWDELNGWRSFTPSPLGEAGIPYARRKRDEWRKARKNHA